MTEGWREKEIADLKVQKAALEAQEQTRQEQQVFENIWEKAFANLNDPDKDWAVPETLRQGLLAKGHLPVRTDFVGGGGVLRKFVIRLTTGACEYLQNQHLRGNRIIPSDIVKVLQRSKRYGHLVRGRTVREWLDPDGPLKEVIDDYKIDARPNINIEQKWVDAIHQWWKKNPDAAKINQSDVARSIGELPESLYSLKTQYPDTIGAALRERPEDV